MTLLKLAIAMYRVNPLRPHCNAGAGRHVWLCSLLGLDAKGNPCGVTRAYEGNTRCPSKDA